MHVCVCVLVPGKTIFPETYGAPVYPGIPAAPRPCGDLPLAGTSVGRRLARPPQASDLGVISSAVRLCDVLPRGHTGLLVENCPQGWGGGSPLPEQALAPLIKTQRQFRDIGGHGPALRWGGAGGRS